MKLKRIIAALLSIVTVLGVLAGCSAKKMAITLNVDGKKIKVTNVATIGDIDVPMYLYRYFYLNTKKNADNGDDSFWDSYPTANDELKVIALNYCKNYVAITELSKQRGIELTKEEQDEIDTIINDAVEQAGSYPAFVASLQANYLTEDMYRDLMKIEILSGKLQDSYFNEGGEYYLNDDSFVEYIKNDHILTRHILVSSSNENYETVINTVRTQLSSGADFATLASSYSDDTASANSQADGICYKKGTVIEGFYNTAISTPVGQISEVDTEEYGHFFIQRLDLSKDYILTNKDSLMEDYMSSKMTEIVEGFIEEKTITMNEHYDKITMDSLK